MRKQPQESPQNKPKPPIAAQDRAKLDLCMAARQELLGRLEARDAEIDRLKALVAAVHTSEYDGTRFDDVDGVNWFDARNTLLEEMDE